MAGSIRNSYIEGNERSVFILCILTWLFKLRVVAKIKKQTEMP